MLYKSRRGYAAEIQPVQVPTTQVAIIQEPSIPKENDSLSMIMNEIKDLKEQLSKAKIRNVSPEIVVDPVIESYRDYIKSRLSELNPVELRKNRVIMDPDTFYCHYCDWIKTENEIPLNKRNFRIAIVDCDPSINRTQMRFNGERKYTITIQRDWFVSS